MNQHHWQEQGLPQRLPQLLQPEGLTRESVETGQLIDRVGASTATLVDLVGVRIGNQTLQVSRVDPALGVVHRDPTQNPPAAVPALEFVEVAPLVPHVGQLAEAPQPMDHGPLCFNIGPVAAQIDVRVRQRVDAALELGQDG
jgi:hypothetical protein